MGTKRSVVLVAMALAALAGCSSGPTSMGIIYGDPTGLAVRHKAQSDRTINFALGVTALDANIGHGHIDYMFHFDRIRRGDPTFYVGVGATYLFRVDDNNNNTDVGFGPRVPFGVSFQGRDFDLFLQGAAYFVGDLDFSWAVGVRFGI